MNVAIRNKLAGPLNKRQHIKKLSSVIPTLMVHRLLRHFTDLAPQS